MFCLNKTTTCKYNNIGWFHRFTSENCPSMWAPGCWIVDPDLTRPRLWVAWLSRRSRGAAMGGIPEVCYLNYWGENCRINKSSITPTENPQIYEQKRRIHITHQHVCSLFGMFVRVPTWNDPLAVRCIRCKENGIVAWMIIQEIRHGRFTYPSRMFDCSPL